MDRGEGAARLDLYVLLMKLRDGGCIVSSAACSSDELVIARATRCLYVDKDGFGYVYRPKVERTG